MKYLGRSILALVALSGTILLLSGSAPVATANDTPNTRYVTLSADGTVKVTPDVVNISATVTVVGASNSEALTQGNTSSSAVRQALKANGIDINDIATQNISVYPEYDYANNVSKLIGYRASQSFAITVHNVSKAGVIVDAIVAAGGNNIQLNSVSPSLSNPQVGLEAARARAVKEATFKAKSYANLLGVKLGRVNYLIENSAPTPYPIYATTSKDASAPTQVDLGQQSVTVNVTIQWALV